MEIKKKEKGKQTWRILCRNEQILLQALPLSFQVMLNKFFNSKFFQFLIQHIFLIFLLVKLRFWLWYVKVLTTKQVKHYIYRTCGMFQHPEKTSVAILTEANSLKSVTFTLSQSQYPICKMGTRTSGVSVKTYLVLLMWKFKPLLTWVSWKKAKKKVAIVHVETHLNSGICLHHADVWGKLYIGNLFINWVSSTCSKQGKSCGIPVIYSWILISNIYALDLLL